MNAIESFRVAIGAILTNKGRSFLTMLGVTVGVAAVILIVSVGEGARGDVGEELRGLGSNLIILTPGRDQTRGDTRQRREERKRGRRRRESVTPLKTNDLRVLKKYCPSVAEAAAGIEGGAEAKVGTPVWYGRWWELDAPKPRPFIRPSIKEKQPRVMEIILEEMMKAYG